MALLLLGAGSALFAEGRYDAPDAPSAESGAGGVERELFTGPESGAVPVPAPAITPSGEGAGEEGSPEMTLPPPAAGTGAGEEEDLLTPPDALTLEPPEIFPFGSESESEPEAREETPPAAAAAPGPEPPARVWDVIPEAALVFSRTVEAAPGQIVEVPFRETGWVYLGEKDSRRGLVYESARTGDEGQSFLFRALEEGTYALAFYREDPLRGGGRTDYVQVSVTAPGGATSGGATGAASGAAGTSAGATAIPGTTGGAAGADAGAAGTGASGATSGGTNSAAGTSAGATALPGTTGGAAGADAGVTGTGASGTTSGGATGAVSGAASAGAGTAALPGTTGGAAGTDTGAAGTGTAALPGAAGVAGTDGSGGTVAAAAVPGTATAPGNTGGETAGEMIARAEAEFAAGRTTAALAILDDLQRAFPEALLPASAAGATASAAGAVPGLSAEDIAAAWWLRARILEADGPERNIKLSLEYYHRLVDTYPTSPYVPDARERIAYLERRYINIR